MKILSLVLFFASLVLFSSCSKTPDITSSNPSMGSQRTIFVDPSTGNDENTGREISSPLKTLMKASLIGFNGDTVYVKGGIYTGFKDVIAKHQTDLSYIYFRPYSGQSVIFDGTGGTYTETDAILTIMNSTYVDIAGFEIRNNTNGRGINILSNDKYCQFIKISNCNIHDISSSGIYFGCSDFTVDNCEIYNTCLINRNRALGDNGRWPSAIQSYFKYNSAFPQGADFVWRSANILNNKIFNNWGEGLKFSRTADSKVIGNKIYNCYNAGIVIDNSRDALAYNNFIFSTSDEFNRVSSSGYNRPLQGIVLSNEKNEFLANPQTENIVIYNNLMVRTSAPFVWHYDVLNAIPSNSYKRIKIIYNTSFNTIGNETFSLDVNSFSGRYIPVENEFKNNIIYKPLYSAANQNYFTASSDYNQYWSITNNCFASGDIPPFISTVNISGNPAFVNSSSLTPDGFKISNSSVCKGAGIGIASITLDYFLNARSGKPSIGFFELLK